MLALAFAPAPLPKRVKPADDRRQFDGTWVVQSLTDCGNELGVVTFQGGLGFHPNELVVISQGRLHFPSHGGRAPRQRASWEIQTLQGTRQIDLLQIPEGPARMLGIYALEGETLTLAFTTEISQRPEGFSGLVMVIHLKRGGP